MFCKMSSAFYLFSKIQQISYSYNSAKIDKDIAQLIDDDEIKKTKGIWQYELAINSGEAGATKYLNFRGFPKDMMRKKLKEQEYHCPLCIEEGNDKTYTLSEMEGDHITPWSEGGKTEYDNLQMLCKRHNRLKSNH
ncbi:HNH endonuclease [Lactobacillus sp. MRS-253-APC-2B]|uniref:HNH endonuclease n=1 Tax=Lactobacillus sp. MRS-253-APC-2B TaxID=2725305 RepID=UPI00146D37CC|nr:HNH endonuclease [Lactobacillus sp. MRS-253-APC-2B]